MAEPTDPLPELERRLREAGAEELTALVREHANELDPQAVRQALRNVHCTVEATEEIAAQTRLLSFYEVRRDLAMHPRTPEILGLRFIQGLYWRDLLALGCDTRLRPTLRRAADLQLGVRLPQMAQGEKVSLARRASAGVLSQLRYDLSPQVMAAVLDNPRLTEGVLAPVAARVSTPAAVLALIAGDRRWGVRYPLRVALARNPSTPLEIAWRLLGTLRRSDLQPVAADPRCSEPVRRRARILLKEPQRDGPGEP